MSINRHSTSVVYGSEVVNLLARASAGGLHISREEVAALLTYGKRGRIGRVVWHLQTYPNGGGLLSTWHLPDELWCADCERFHTLNQTRDEGDALVCKATGARLIEL